MLKRIMISAFVAVAAMLPAAAAHAGGVTGPAIYVNGTVFRTVGTPTDFSRTKAPEHSFDTIYEFSGAQMNVATAGPGDAGYNGGRWRVHLLGWNSTYAAAVAAHDIDGNGVLDTNAEVWGALADAGASGAQDLGVVKSFECPLIPYHG
ncbi:MAG: hypothetical protein ACRDGO_08275 [Actinomycetota bacterium]